MAQSAPNYLETTPKLLQNYPKTTRSSSNYLRVETTPKLPKADERSQAFLFMLKMSTFKKRRNWHSRPVILQGKREKESF